jgi:alkanesulfonate monooxygenase SsuD/methylene tetrahydromethanopterin reductase-like flavin-dependent oxidoreductase (luciferase family)
MHEFKIGYNLGTLISGKDLLLFSKLADGMKNVDSIWIPESWGREAFSSLGAMSQVTKNVKLGTSIISIYARTPATAAMAATTLDILSCNRTILGLGVSSEAIVLGWHGVKFIDPLERMREYIDCLKLIVKGEKVRYDGRFFEIKNFKLVYEPQRTKIPIYIAAINKKMILLSCTQAEGVLLYLRPIEELRETISFIKSHAIDKEFQIGLVLIGALSNKEPEKAKERAAKTLAFYIAVGKYYNRFLAKNGFKIEVEQITAEYHLRGLDVASKYVSEKMLNSLTVCGNSEECIKSLRAFVSKGVSLPIIQVNPVGDSESSFKEMLSTF